MGEIIEAGSITLDKEQPKIVDAGSIELDKPVPVSGPSIQTGKSPTLTDRFFRLFEDPGKEQAKAVQALVDSQALGISPSQAYKYRDQIDEGVNINPQAAAKRSTLTDRVKQSFDIGVKQNRVGELGYQYIITGDAKYLDAINKIGMPGPNDVYLSEGKLETAFRAAAKMLPMMADTAAESTGAGLSTGMAVAGAVALLGQAGPQVALPEEIVTVPAAFATGFTAGAGAKAFEASVRKEAGLALSEIIKLKDKDGKQIDPTIARAASFGIGVVNGAIEVSQLKMLIKTIPGLNKVISKAFIETVADKAVKEKLVRLATAYGGTVSKETGQEIAQESTNIIFEELAKRVNNNVKGTQLDPAKADDVVKRLYDTAIESAQAFSVFAAPGTMVSAGKAIMPARQVKPQQGGTRANTVTNAAPGLAGISALESGGKYTAEHPTTRTFGKYQIMPSNWGPWAKEAGLPEDAKQTPENQEIVANFKYNQYLNRFGGDDQLAAVAWFAGPARAQRLMSGDMSVLDKTDANGTTVAQYIKRTTGREFGVAGQGVASQSVSLDDMMTRITETDDNIDQIANDYFAGLVTEERVEETGNWFDVPAGAAEGVTPINVSQAQRDVTTGQAEEQQSALAETIKITLNEKGSIDLTPIVDLGRSVYQQGARTYEQFSARVKELVGDAWEKVKDLVKQAYEIVKNERGSVTISKGSSKEGPPAYKKESVKSSIRQVTGQVKDKTKTVTERDALKSALKKAAQAAKEAFKAGNKAALQDAVKDIRTIKQKIAEFVGMRQADEKTVTEYNALKAAFTKAAQAARIAYRAGDKAGVDKAKTHMRDILQRAREKRIQVSQRAKDIKTIKKLGQSTSGIAVDYQKKIRDLMTGFDFKNISEAKWAQLQGLKDFIDKNEVPLGINPKRLVELKRLTDIALKSLDNDQIAMLRKQLEELTAIGKLKATLKYKYNERRHAAVLKKIISTTQNLDPSVTFTEGKISHFDKLKVAAINMYLNTMHTPRVSDLADGRKGYKGEQTKLIKMAGQAETKAVTMAANRQQRWLDFLATNNINLPVEGSESDIRMSIVIRHREKAFIQVKALMKAYGIDEIPTLTPEEEMIIEYIRQDMEQSKATLAAIWEEINNEIFPEIPIYYLPLKYVGEEEIITDTHVEGRGRTVHTFEGFSHERQSKVKKLPRIGIAQLYQEATMEQEWYKGLQPVIEDIKSVVLTDEYQEVAGDLLYDWWKTQLDIMARRGWTASAQLSALSSALGSIRHNITTAALGFKLTTILLQPLAAFDAMAYVNSYFGPVAAAKILGAVTHSFLSPSWAKSIIKDSDALQHRNAGELAVQEELERLKNSKMDKAKKAGFHLIQKADILTAAGVQESVRKTLLDQGLDEATALSEAEFIMHMSQGSTSVTYRPHILGMGEGYRTWFTFQTFILNRWGILIHDIINGKIVHGEGVKGRLIGLISLGILVAGGEAEDEARRKIRQLYSNPKEDKRNIIEQMTVNILSSMPFFNSFIAAASQKFDAYPPTLGYVDKLFEGAFQLIKGKDTKSKVLGGLKVSESLLTLIVGIPGTAQVFDMMRAGVKRESANDRRNK